MGAVKPAGVLASPGMTSQPEPPQPLRVTAARARTERPALLYVLAAFGLVTGAFGAQNAVATGVALLAPRDTYVRAIAAHNEPLKAMVPAAELERYGLREADARYSRRNAALPLAGVGLILSCLLFAGCLRAMLGDGWGVAAWSLAAAASIPYQLLSGTLNYLLGRDLLRVLADAPSTAMLLVAQAQFETYAARALAGIGVVYFAACLLYLRTRTVRSSFSVGRRTPPSA